VLEPTIGNYFRNSAQDSDVIAFLSTRKERQDSAKFHIKKVLDEYNVNAVDTLIGDITPPESLMKTLTDRKIAEDQKVTYETQKKAQETRQGMEKETAIADMQKEIVSAQQSVEIAVKKRGRPKLSQEQKAANKQMRKDKKMAEKAQIKEDKKLAKKLAKELAKTEKAAKKKSLIKLKQA
jgi:regulator of protease activity HflC (stomatin/prohibitin superfamily)